ncbi:ATP-binding protein [bacterium]|nr:ATP-binding protein [bacterium]
MFNRPKYLNQLIDFKDKEQIKVITGIRRCGKSSLLDLFIEYLKTNNVKDENILHINFESLKYANMTYLDLNDFIEKKINNNNNGKLYLFLDEIQKIDKWELTVNSLRLNKNIDIYITGSNAYLLSSQLSTYLSGRYVEIKMQPLTFDEFLVFNKFDKSATNLEKFNLYLKFGGMPGLKDFAFNERMINQTLEGIFSTVLVKDIIDHAEIKNVALLKKITSFLADNIGNPISLNKIKNTLVSQNLITKGIHLSAIDNFISLLENAFVFYGIKRYDIKGKEYLKTQGKYYISDIGLRNFFLGYRDIDRGHILENIVFLELLSRGYKVSIGKIDKTEVDFIASSSNEIKYIQVCETLMSETTRQRELTPLINIKDNYEKIILTMDNLFVGVNEKGIKIFNIIEWLLNK